MRRVRYWAVALLVTGSFSSALQAEEAGQAEAVEQRLERLERMVNNQSLLEMLQRLDSLQQEVAQLRGLVEEQQHTIEGLKSRQRELYMDVDRRLLQMEREGGAHAPASSTPPLGSASGGGTLPLTTAGAGSAQDKPEPAAKDDKQQEREAYQQAFDMLRELRYAQATAAFRDFLKRYPQGSYAHIAQYWLGEAGYAQRDFRQAIKDYNSLLVNYPNSPKLPEAMLKMGYSHYELKEYEPARQVLEELIQQYPDSTEAGQARNLLKRINKNAG